MQYDGEAAAVYMCCTAHVLDCNAAIEDSSRAHALHSAVLVAAVRALDSYRKLFYS